MKNSFSFLFILVLFFITPTNSLAENLYFVSPSGDDHGTGEYESPFKTIQHAIDQSKHGDTIYVKKGTYYELLTIHTFKATSNQFLTIRPFDQDKVTIDGSKRTNSNQAGFSIVDSSNIRIQGFEIQNITTDDDDFYPAGILIKGSSKNIHIIGNKIHTIANFHRKGNAHGLLVYGNSPTPIENIKIRKNHLYNLTLGKSETLTISGNVTNFLIDRNYLYNNNNIGIDIAGHYNACVEKGCIDQARHGVISNNRVENHSSEKNIAYKGSNSAAGIYIDGAKDISVLNNYVATNNFGISVSSENSGKKASSIIVRGNTIKNNEKAGIVIGGSSTDNGGVTNVLVKNNKFIGNDTSNDQYKEVTLQQNIEKLTLQENSYARCGFDYINNTSKTKNNVSIKDEMIRHLLSQCIK